MKAGTNMYILGVHTTHTWNIMHIFVICITYTKDILGVHTTHTWNIMHILEECIILICIEPRSIFMDLHTLLVHSTALHQVFLGAPVSLPPFFCTGKNSHYNQLDIR